MGASASSTAGGARGVPMPPQAWALFSLWSAVWDAPRFQGPGRVHPPALSREALAPLLKIAASCVTTLQPYTGRRYPAGGNVPPHGASRELLTAAVDGHPRGRALASPVRNPERFVRALVRASFQTGDGNFVEGLSGGSLDALLEAQCRPQLECAASLGRDPGAELRGAMESARAALEELTTAPLPSGDLEGIAKRLLLAQRLERIAEEAKQISAIAGALAETDEDRTEPPVEDFMEEDEIPTIAWLAGSKADETGSNEAQYGSQADRESVEAASGRSDQEALKRTQSQIMASLQIKKVKQKLDSEAEEIHDLRRTATLLSKHQVPENQVEALQVELDAVEQAARRARIFGEDLIEDMLALDSLSKLLPEDRPVRKAAITGIESLLEDVDTANARLSTLHRDLEQKVADALLAQQEAQWQAEEAEEAAAMEEEAERDKVLEAAVAEVRDGDEDERDKAEGQKRRRAAASGAGVEAEEAEDVSMAEGGPPPEAPCWSIDVAQDAPQPGKATWQRVRLPLQFHSREEEDFYMLTATIPGLDASELQVEESNDGKKLYVSGLRLPTAEQAAQMQQKIVQRIQGLVRRAPRKYMAIRNQLPMACADAYIELGQGEFGRFSEAFRIPEDVNNEDIKASYLNGMLQIFLPRRVFGPSRAPPGRDRYLGGSRANRAPPVCPPSDAHPGAAHPADEDEPGPTRGPRAKDERGAARLFGGLDDNLWW